MCLRVLFPFGAVGRSRGAAPTVGAEPGPEADGGTPDDLRHRHRQLTHAYQELQSELQETNRGVVALHAELETNADKLRQAEDRLRLLLDSVHDYAICMLTPQGEIASWNAGAERLFLYKADEIIGRSFSCFYPAGERDLDVPAEHLRVAEERGKHGGEVPASSPWRRGLRRARDRHRGAARAGTRRSKDSRWSSGTSPNASGWRRICGVAPKTWRPPTGRRKTSWPRCRTSSGRR